jgi:hypothetical protein
MVTIVFGFFLTLCVDGLIVRLQYSSHKEKVSSGKGGNLHTFCEGFKSLVRG